MVTSSEEVERKFLLDTPPEGLGDRPRTKIRQGYLAITEAGTEVRVRQQGKQHFLTIKDGLGLVRGEEEFEINPAQFASLWPLTKGKRIRKVRHEVPDVGATIQVDVFRRKLQGLVTAEIEFPDEEAARRFQAPPWLGREVTGDERFSNQNLARDGMPQETSR